MTDKERLEVLRKVARIAGAISLEVPDKPHRHASAAKVPWPLIVKLRAALTEAGFDMALARANYDRLGEQREKRRQRYLATIARQAKERST